MNPILQNKFVRVAGIAIAILLIIFVALMFLASMNSARSLGLSESGLGYAPSVMSPEMGMNKVAYDGMMQEMESSYYPPVPVPSGYTSDLEQYETSSYSVTARTKQFDELCGTLKTLKTDSQIHFKSINESTNNCNATFFVDEGKETEVLNTLTAYTGVEYTRNTSSVTRHRQNIESQTSIINQQLTSVQKSLTSAEAQFDEIAEFARQSKDAATLSEAIRYKLQNIDSLTQRKINLTSQLDRLYQQAADLEERIDVVQFDVSVYRSNPIYPNRDSQKWEAAWNDLSDTFTDTLIGLSAFFGVFILWGIQITIYLLVVIIFLRALWKFIKLLWRKW